MTTTAGERPAFTNPYAVDGKCHNAEPGTYNHECGNPAEWLGVMRENSRRQDASAMGFCAKCKETGYEAKHALRWISLMPMTATEILERIKAMDAEPNSPPDVLFNPVVNKTLEIMRERGFLDGFTQKVVAETHYMADGSVREIDHG